MRFVLIFLALTFLVGVDAECRRGATHQQLGGTDATNVEHTSYSGSSELQKDISCCAKCKSNEKCEYWVRATDSNDCWLRTNYGNTIIGTAHSSRRGGYRDDPVKCFVTGDGAGGSEEHLGTANNAAECLTMAKAKAGANGATFANGDGPGKCYAEYGMTISNGDTDWITCLFVRNSLGTATCDDGILNQDEERTDCGGSCPACPGYRLLTSIGYCKHSDGKYLSICKGDATDKNACEDACESSNSCVGYYYGDNSCYLFPSSQSYSPRTQTYTTECPTLFNIHESSWTAMAETSDDLVARYKIGYSCYAKN